MCLKISNIITEEINNYTLLNDENTMSDIDKNLSSEKEKEDLGG